MRTQKLSNSWGHDCGFTMIEMMVAITIIAIAATVAVPGFNQFVANTQIRNTAESIKNGLQLARAEAVKRNASVMFTLETDTSWEIGCVNVVVDACPEVIQSKSRNEGASPNISIDIDGNNTIAFTGLGTVTTAGNQMAQVDIDHDTLPADDTRNLRILIGTGGAVRMCDPNIESAADARSC